MYCVSSQLVRQCDSQRVFSFAWGAGSVFPSFTHEKCKITSDPFLYRAKNLESLGLLALFFCVFLLNNFSKEQL